MKNLKQWFGKRSDREKIMFYYLIVWSVVIHDIQKDQHFIKFASTLFNH